MRSNSGVNGLVLLFSFCISILFTTAFSSHGYATEVEDYIDSKVLEFSVTQEQLYQDFVQYIFRKNCPLQMENAQAWLAKTGRKRVSIPMKWVNYLDDRNERFLQTLKDCENYSFVVDLTDRFKLKVPEYFKNGTLVLAQLKLLSDTDPETLPERVAEADTAIQTDLKTDYTPERLYYRLTGPEPIVRMWDEDDSQFSEVETEGLTIPTPVQSRPKHHCHAEGCKVKVPTADVNFGYCSHCEGNFCKKHRLLEQHHCVKMKEAKEEGLRQLEKELPLVVADKVAERI